MFGLLFDDGSVAQPQLAPAPVERALGERRFRCFFLVDFDAPARFFAHPQIAVAPLGTALKNRLRPLVEGRVLLNAEVVAHQVQRDIRHVAYRRYVAGAVPSRLYAEGFGENCDLARRAESAHLRQMNANIVDEPLGDQRLPLMRIVEQLAHGDWSGAVLPYLAKIP